MRVALYILLAMGTMALPTGCGDDGPSENDITGSWYATKVEYVSRSGSKSVDLIAEGCTATLSLGRDHVFFYTCTPLEGEPTILTASWKLIGDYGDVMKVTPVDSPWSMEFDVEFCESTLKLTHGGSMYDFENDGIMEDADWNLTLMRESPPGTVPCLNPGTLSR